MRSFISVLVLLLVFTFLLTGDSFARNRSSSDLLREGLLGAGAGAAGSAVGGGNAGTGALVGAGVNILGGALLDSMSNDQQEDYPPQRRTYDPEPAGTYQTGTPGGSYSQGYEDGYSNGYKKGYTDGYKEGLKEGVKN
jgi:hypothetical protein